MVLIVGDEAIYSELSTLECKIFMQILPKGTLLPGEQKENPRENYALLSGGKRKSNCLKRKKFVLRGENHHHLQLMCAVRLLLLLPFH